MIRTIWCLTVGVKYGFYSLPLLKLLRKRNVPSFYIMQEQILFNWAPDLGRLMFELHVVTAHLPRSISFSFSISKKHPVAVYLQRCKQVNDVPLCLLQPASISEILHKLPAHNFHKLFWTDPPPTVTENVSLHANSTAIELQSYASHASGVNTSAFVSVTAASAGASSAPLNVAAATGSLPLKTSALLGGMIIAPSEPLHTPPSSPKLSPVGDEHSSRYAEVPAVVLMAYAISRAWCMGRAWIGTAQRSSRVYSVIMLMAAVLYAIPGVMRVVQARCLQGPPHFVVVDRINLCSLAHSLCSPPFATGYSHAKYVWGINATSLQCTSATHGPTSYVTHAGSSACISGFPPYAAS